MNTAIIVAAGSGSRFDSETPKQFQQLNGKPLIVHTLERFDACEAIDRIVLVLSENHIEAFGGQLAAAGLQKPVTLAAGGATRAHSVAHGLAAIEPGTAIVVVHDGARPLVTVDEIERTVRKAEEAGAACLVGPVTETIKQVDGEHIVGTLDRRSLRRALTPQAFKRDVIEKAFADESLFDSATDECFLVERLGTRIAAVPGGHRNIKVTYRDDLVLAAALMNEELE